MSALPLLKADFLSIATTGIIWCTLLRWDVMSGFSVMQNSKNASRLRERRTSCNARAQSCSDSHHPPPPRTLGRPGYSCITARVVGSSLRAQYIIKIRLQLNTGKQYKNAQQQSLVIRLSFSGVYEYSRRGISITSRRFSSEKTSFLQQQTTKQDLQRRCYGAPQDGRTRSAGPLYVTSIWTAFKIYWTTMTG